MFNGLGLTGRTEAILCNFRSRPTKLLSLKYICFVSKSMTVRVVGAIRHGTEMSC
jgi:hypothetical protein